MIIYDFRGPGVCDFILTQPDVAADLADMLDIPDDAAVIVQGVACHQRLICAVAWVDPATKQPTVHDARVVLLEDEMKSRHITIK